MLVFFFWRAHSSGSQDIRAFFGAAKKKPVDAAAVPPKPSPQKKPVSAAGKRALSDDELADAVVSGATAKKSKAAGPSPTKSHASKSPKKTPKKETPQKKRETPAKKETPKKAAAERKKLSRMVLASSDDDEKDGDREKRGKKSAPAPPAKKAAKRAADEDDVVVLSSSSDEDVPLKAQPKKAEPKKSPAKKEAKKTEPPKKEEAKKPEAPKKAAPGKKSPAKKKTGKKAKEDEEFDGDDEDDEEVVVSPTKKKAKSESGAAVAAPAAPAAPAAASEKKKFNWRAATDKPTPPMLGLKPLPVGAENCLFGKVFVITGTLESLDRPDAERLIVQYAGEVAKSVAKKCTHALVGTEPGPSKIKDIEERKLVIVNEDELFKMIQTLPGKKVSKEFDAKRAKKEKLATEGKEQPAAVVEAIRNVPANEKLAVQELWTTKYAPQDSGKLLANPGPIKKVRDWLNRWKNPAVVKDKSFKRALLVSGVPGIGKTTTAALLAREAGYDVLEFNASDARSKKRLKEEGFMEIGGNRSLNEFFGSTNPATKRNKKTLIIMDEVDGMGAGDRGGNQELVAAIKKTRIPVICICNDRQKASVKTLANYCEDVRFQRPQAVDIAGRMRVIMENEGFKSIDVGALQLMCASVNNDIRQVLNLLQMLRLRTDRLDASPESFQTSMAEGRHVERNAFTVSPQLFSGSTRSPNKALDLFFHDYDLMPLFIQENYIHAIPAAQSPVHQMRLFADAADVISYGDLVKDQVMKSQDWGLLPFLGMVSTVVPCAIVRGRLSRVEFPSWLGKNSSANKSKRVLKELQVHMSAHTCGTDKNEIRLDYIPNLLEPLIRPLETKGQDGIDEVMALMDEYGLTKDDWESMFLLAGKEERTEALDPKLKSAFTRKYNKTQKRVAVAPVAGGKRGKGGASRIAEEEEEFLDDEVKEYNKSEEEEDGAAVEDDVERDAMIKKPKKKKAPGPKKPKAATASALKKKK